MPFYAARNRCARDPREQGTIPMQQPNPNPNRDRNQTNNAMRIRTLVLVAFFVIFLFGLLIYQLYVLQLRDAEDYRAQAAEQQLSDDILPATRGAIYSATGKLLAKSSAVWNIIANPKDCDEAYLSEASEKISELLGGTVSAESILEKLNSRTSQYKVIARGVDMLTKDAILEYTNTKRKQNEKDPDEQARRVLSFYSEQSATRSYPYGAFLSSVLGFCNSEGTGVYGLEKSYEETLAGTPGRSISTQNGLGYTMNGDEAETHDPINGNNLNLTIDENIQGVVEDALTQAIADYNVQNRASALIMNVNTGAVLAMATLNQFDPNTPNVIYDDTMASILENGTLDAASLATLQSRLGEKAVADIVADGLIDSDEYTTVQGMMREAQWKNKALTELYYPGSVFKLVTAASALDSGLMDTSQSFYCGGSLVVNPESEQWRHEYRCASGASHGWLDMAGALNYSCNLYFIHVAESMTPQFFYNYYQAFGLTQATGIDLPHEARGLSYDADEMEKTQTTFYSSAFGQAQKITPIQMASAVAATVNGGYLVTPHVVDSITDEAGNVVEQIGTTIKRQVISEEVSAEIRAMMEENVGHGTDDGGYHSCKSAYVAGYRIGGKSGTAEELDQPLRPDGDFRKAISFSAVLPIDDPEILVFVMMDDPRWTYDYASQIVAPVVGNIISEVAPYLGIERDSSYTSDGYVTVPDGIGTGWTTVQVNLNRLGLSHKLIGSSGSIVYQYPYAGTRVPAGSTIYFYTATDQDTMTTVPDATGKTGSFAVQMMQAAGLNVDLQGDENARVTTQDIAANSSMPMGTVVTLQTAADTAADGEATGDIPAADPDPAAQDAVQPG